jgi:hypothetical protein
MSWLRGHEERVLTKLPTTSLKDVLFGYTIYKASAAVKSAFSPTKPTEFYSNISCPNPFPTHPVTNYRALYTTYLPRSIINSFILLTYFSQYLELPRSSSISQMQEGEAPMS